MHKVEVPQLIEDNLRNYIQMLLGFSEFSDPQAKVTFRKGINKYMVTIEPNDKDFRQDIIDNILFLHRKFKIPITYSSSLGISHLIQFTIETETNPQD